MKATKYAVILHKNDVGTVTGFHCLAYYNYLVQVWNLGFRPVKRGFRSLREAQNAGRAALGLKPHNAK